MPLRFIQSFSSPPFIPVEKETNPHFLGRYLAPRIYKHQLLWQNQDLLKLVDVNFHFVGRYRLNGLISPLSLRQYQDTLVPVVGGWSPGVPYTVATGLTATGNSQATALPLNAQLNQITGVISSVSNDGIITRTTPGDPTIVANYSGNDINIWPPVGGQINKLGVNTFYTISDGSSMEFVPTSSTQFYSKTP